MLDSLSRCEVRSTIKGVEKRERVSRCCDEGLCKPVLARGRCARSRCDFGEFVKTCLCNSVSKHDAKRNYFASRKLNTEPSPQFRALELQRYLRAVYSTQIN